MAAASGIRAATLTKAAFGKMPDGAAIDIYTLTARNGVEARITNYGGIVVSLKTPDRNGALADIVLGFDTLQGYLDHPGIYFGAIIGRYANRIGKARFKLDGVDYKLSAGRIRPARVDAPRAARWRPRAHLPEQGRRGGLSRQSARDGRLSSDRLRRIAYRLRGYDG
jgi:hypothetical protein